MQTILGNPSPSRSPWGSPPALPSVAPAGIVLGWKVVTNPQLNLAVIAWISSVGATAVIVIAAILRGARAETMVLLSIGLVFFFQALLALIQYRASAEALSQIVFWSLGSMTRATWVANGLLAVVLVVVCPLLASQSWKLTALRLGDARAQSMGVNRSRLRIIVLAFAGIIGFVGLVGPHIARMLVGEGQRYLIPASMASGVALMCCAHVVSLMAKWGWPFRSAL